MVINSNEKKMNSQNRIYGFIGVALIAVAAIAVTLVLQLFNIRNFLWIYQLLILIASGIGIYFILRKTFYEYVYTFGKDHFLIHQLIGSKDSIVFAVAYEDVRDFGPLSSLKIDPDKKSRLEKYYLSETNQEIYYLRYHDINKNCDKILTFKPSSAIIENLSGKIS